jgi:hypothetical protein
MRVGPLDQTALARPESSQVTCTRAGEVVALAIAAELLLRGLEASETYDSLPAASPRAGTSKHTRRRATRSSKTSI